MQRNAERNQPSEKLKKEKDMALATLNPKLEGFSKEDVAYYFNCAVDYINRIMSTGAELNFWMSPEYLLRRGAILVHGWRGMNVWGFRDEDNDGWLIPPIRDNHCNYDGEEDENLFAGIPCDYIFDKEPYEFLDYQFIYDPLDFLEIKGHKWEAFRKNVRKYPNRHPGILEYWEIKSDFDVHKLAKLITPWAATKDVYEPEVLLDYVARGHHRWGLFLNGNLVGMNIWDHNRKYINYRYCIDDGSPFLQEHLRYRFYTSSEILDSNKLVNDGGSLGNDGLYAFKQKLNPMRIWSVYSKKGKESEDEGGSNGPTETTRVSAAGGSKSGDDRAV